MGKMWSSDPQKYKSACIMVICVATEFTGNMIPAIHGWMEKVDTINGIGEDIVKGLLLHWLDTASHYKIGKVVSMDILPGAFSHADYGIKLVEGFHGVGGMEWNGMNNVNNRI